MGNVNLPTPVALAGGAICILGGYLFGVLAGPDTTSRTTATVTSFDGGTGELCLSGPGVKGQKGADGDDTLCGTWRRAGTSTTPEKGDEFRFVTLSGGGSSGTGAQARPATLIYGDELP
jgi:hypothetical protein